MDLQATCRFLFRQHSSVSESIVARAEPVAMDEIGDSQGGETSIASPASRRSAGAKSLLVESVGNPGISMVVEELVDQLDGLRLRLHLLRGGLGVQGSYQVEMSDEGLMTDDIEACFRVVLDALPTCDLPAAEVIAWCAEMLKRDRVGFLGDQELRALRQPVEASRSS